MLHEQWEPSGRVYLVKAMSNAPSDRRMAKGASRKGKDKVRTLTEKQTELERDRFRGPPQGFRILKKSSTSLQTTDAADQKVRSEPLKRTPKSDSQLGSYSVAKSTTLVLHSPFVCSFVATLSGEWLPFPRREWQSLILTNQVYSDLTFPGSIVVVGGAEGVGKSFVATLLTQPAGYLVQNWFNCNPVQSKTQVVVHLTYDNIAIVELPAEMQLNKFIRSNVAKLCNVALWVFDTSRVRNVAEDEANCAVLGIFNRKDVFNSCKDSVSLPNFDALNSNGSLLEAKAGDRGSLPQPAEGCSDGTAKKREYIVAQFQAVVLNSLSERLNSITRTRPMLEVLDLLCSEWNKVIAP